MLPKLSVTVLFIIMTVFVSAQGIYNTATVRNASLAVTKDKKFIIDSVKPAAVKNYDIEAGSENKTIEARFKKFENGRLTFDLSSVGNDFFPVNLVIKKSNGIAKFPIANKSTTIKKDASPQSSDEPMGDRFTGIAFWDADVIYKQLEANAPDKDTLILNIIHQYSEKRYGALKDLVVNPFFKKINTFSNQADTFLKNTKGIGSLTPYKNEAGAQSNATTLVSSILGSASGIDVTKYVQAFADFLKGRIKEELTVAYISRLKDTLQHYVELQYLLPKTFGVFTNNDVFAIPSMGPVYKAAFAEDLAAMAPNLINLVYSEEKYKHLRDNDGFISFMFAYQFADLSAKGYHPADILHRINNSIGYSRDYLTPTRSGYLISALSMFSDNLRDTTAESGWIKKENINLVNKDFINLFLGLLYEKYEPLFTDTTVTGKRNLLTIFLSTSFATDKLFDVLTVAKTLDARIKEFTSAAEEIKKATAVDVYIENADAILDLVSTTAVLTGIDQKYPAEYQKWNKIITNAVGIAKSLRDTSSNGIGSVAINSLAIISEFLKTDNTSNLFSQITEITKFISDVAVAKTAEDVRAIIDKNAAPPHSYRVVRTAKSSFSLSSYPGIYAGLERNKQVEAGKLKDKAFGVTAPVGLALNWSLKPGASGKAASLGLFFSMVDIGAALSYRWNNDSSDIPNKITLGQIFAPGLHVVYGFKESPLALKIGYQYAPQLRRIKTDANDVMDKADVWRLSIGLSVDIPVFIFGFKK